MWLSTRENRGLSEEEDMWNEIWQHQQIYTIFLRHILTKVINVSRYLGKQHYTWHFYKTYIDNSAQLSDALKLV